LKQIREYGLVLAIDSPTRDATLGHVASLGPLVDGIKIGVPTLLTNGSSIVSRVRDLFDGPLIADLKVADIGFRAKESGPWSGTNRAIVEAAVSAGINYVICHSIVGTSSIEECVATAHAMGGKVLTLPFMTQRGAGLFFDHPADLSYVSGWLDELGLKSVGDALASLAERKKSEQGWRSWSVTLSDLLILLGEHIGVDGYIGPANRTEVLRDYRKMTSRLVMATGVGRQGGALAEVYESLGKNSAAIVGHSIYDRPDPVAACEEYLAERVQVTRGR